MIKDAKGRKWSMRAQWKSLGQSSGMRLFKTKARAEEDARRTIQSRDAVALGKEYFRRLVQRGTECRLTAADHAAIIRAGQGRG